MVLYGLRIVKSYTERNLSSQISEAPFLPLPQEMLHWPRLGPRWRIAEWKSDWQHFRGWWLAMRSIAGVAKVSGGGVEWQKEPWTCSQNWVQIPKLPAPIWLWVSPKTSVKWKCLSYNVIEQWIKEQCALKASAWEVFYKRYVFPSSCLTLEANKEPSYIRNAWIPMESSIFQADLQTNF